MTEPSFSSIAWKTIDVMRSSQKATTVGAIAEFIRSLNNASFGEAKKELLDYAEISGKKIIVLIDSLESEGYIIDDANTFSALQGLLKWVGDVSSAVDSSIQVRLCIPGEYHFQFAEISSNPIKDFARHCVLHWRPRDLIQVAAQRYLHFLQHHDPTRFNTWKDVDLHDPQHAALVFDEFVPRDLHLETGDPTNIHYILRYTQLLPRQLLSMLSRLFLNRDGLSKESALQIIKDAQHITVNEIFAAFLYRYPKANEVCSRALPQLSESFTYGELQRIYLRTGKGHYESFSDFLQMLTDIGVIGRVVSSTPSRIVGQFQYNVENRLMFSSKEKLCIHPIFREGLGRGLSSVWPIGGQRL